MDNVVLTTKSTSIHANIHTLEQAANIAFEWADTNAVAFDDPKSELIHFHQQRHLVVKDHCLRLPNGTLVTPKSCLRWLGVWMDSKLSFKEHVKIKAAAALRAFKSIRQLANTEKGLSTSGCWNCMDLVYFISCFSLIFPFLSWSYFMDGGNIGFLAYFSLFSFDLEGYWIMVQGTSLGAELPHTLSFLFPCLTTQAVGPLFPCHIPHCTAPFMWVHMQFLISFFVMTHTCI